MPTIEAASEPAIISSTLQVKNPNRKGRVAAILIQFQKLPASLFPSTNAPIC
jgi:hypothetical protein